MEPTGMAETPVPKPPPDLLNLFLQLHSNLIYLRPKIPRLLTEHNPIETSPSVAAPAGNLNRKPIPVILRPLQRADAAGPSGLPLPGGQGDRQYGWQLGRHDYQ